MTEVACKFHRMASWWGEKEGPAVNLAIDSLTANPKHDKIRTRHHTVVLPQILVVLLLFFFSKPTVIRINYFY